MYKIIFSLLVLFFVLYGLVFAGNLIPTSSPSPSTHTLSDLYNKIINNSYDTNINNSFEFPNTEATSTMYTIEQIWDVIPTISSSSIISGHTIMGVAGGYNISNLTPSLVATGTVYGNGSVGTAQIGGVLEWGQTSGPMKWYQAVIYCSGLGSSWRLPTISELQTGRSAGNWTYFNFADFYSSSYWSGTISISDGNYVAKGHAFVQPSGTISISGVTLQESGSTPDNLLVRCVRNIY